MKRDLERCRERLQATYHLTLSLDGHICTSSLHLETRQASIWDEYLGQAFLLSPAQTGTEQSCTTSASVITVGCALQGWVCFKTGKIPDFLLNALSVGYIAISVQEWPLQQTQETS